MAWTSPTGHNDSDNNWDNETNAYDENETGSWATVLKAGVDAGSYLELTIDTIICDNIRIRTARYNALGEFVDGDVDIDVYYSGGWHNLQSGTITKLTWVTLNIGSEKLVSSSRIKCNTLTAFGSDQFRVYEFDFNQVYRRRLSVNAILGNRDINAYSRIILEET